MAKDDGGPAFPRPGWEGCTDGNYLGMSLRDWFAGLAMQAILGEISSVVCGTPQLVFDDEVASLYAGIAYRVADAMIKARKS